MMNRAECPVCEAPMALVSISNAISWWKSAGGVPWGLDRLRQESLDVQVWLCEDCAYWHPAGMPAPAPSPGPAPKGRPSSRRR